MLCLSLEIYQWGKTPCRRKRNQPNDDKRTRGISSRFLRRGALDIRIFFFPPAEPVRLISRVVVIDTATDSFEIFLCIKL